MPLRRGRDATRPGSHQQRTDFVCCARCLLRAASLKIEAFTKKSSTKGASTMTYLRSAALAALVYAGLESMKLGHGGDSVLAEYI